MHARSRGVCAGAQDFKLPPGETAPLLVKIHGGPTAAAGSSFSLGIQYWTSRGVPRPCGCAGDAHRSSAFVVECLSAVI